MRVLIQVNIEFAWELKLESEFSKRFENRHIFAACLFLHIFDIRLDFFFHLIHDRIFFVKLFIDAEYWLRYFLFADRLPLNEIAELLEDWLVIGIDSIG